jgi:glyoxylase-like metal-dependent hydrolase (beta-lactamase superfamily II)
MKIHVLTCGMLRVDACEMIRPLSEEKIGSFYPVDAEGKIRLTMNALLVCHGRRRVLFDPGTAGFLPPRLRKEYGMEEGEPLEQQLEKLGVSGDRITDVVFTHLHFDHGSGALKRVPGSIVKRFPKANYRVCRSHFEYAKRPHRVEANSFFSSLLAKVGELCWLEDWEEEWIEFHYFDGHTRGMAVPVIYFPERTVYYLTDLVPMEIFLQPGIYSGYDLDPELAVSEKESFLKEVKNYHSNPDSKTAQLVFFHDPVTPVMELP